MKSPRKQNQQPVVDVCDLLWRQIDRPKNLVNCKAINVYSNKYRINVYTKHYDKKYEIDKIRITQSYFAVMHGDKLTIL